MHQFIFSLIPNYKIKEFKFRLKLIRIWLELLKLLNGEGGYLYRQLGSLPRLGLQLKAAS